jgi:bacterioferritin-associated ferredoxin
MFVCICRAVTLARIRAVVEGGARTVDAVEAACGAGGDCGTCRDEIAEAIGACRRYEHARGGVA